MAPAAFRSWGRWGILRQIELERATLRRRVRRVCMEQGMHMSTAHSLHWMVAALAMARNHGQLMDEALATHEAGLLLLQ